MSDSINFKIAVITLADSHNEEEFSMGKKLAEKYGEDKVVHVACPVNFILEQEKCISSVTDLAKDTEIKILIFPQALPGTNCAVDRFKEKRDDVFVIYGFLHEDVTESAARANLILKVNEEGMGSEMVKQAKKQGAKTFVHYSFPRHMDLKVHSRRRDLISKTCMDEGLHFEDITILDPLGDKGPFVAQQLILDEVPKMVAKFGEDTAFFCSNCRMQAPLIKAVIDNHAIYPQPCCPSPYHGFARALGIEHSRYDLHNFITEVSRIAEENNMVDRLSTWPVSATMLFVFSGAEYAIKWLNGEIPGTGINKDILMECMNNYIVEVLGEDGFLYMTPYAEEGKVFDNYKCILMSYLDF